MTPEKTLAEQFREAFQKFHTKGSKPLGRAKLAILCEDNESAILAALSDAEIARLRQLVHDVYSPLYDARTMIELALIGELNMTPDLVKQLQELSAQCESLLGRLIERDKE